MPTYYFLPTRNVFGEGAVQEIGTLFGSLHASRAMIVTDKFLAQSGMAEKISGILAQSGIQSVVFDGAEPNPTDKNVEAGVTFFHNNHCDSIVSLGGGSSHDCAKGIGLVASNGGTIHDYSLTVGSRSHWRSAAIRAAGHNGTFQLPASRMSAQSGCLL